MSKRTLRSLGLSTRVLVAAALLCACAVRASAQQDAPPQPGMQNPGMHGRGFGPRFGDETMRILPPGAWWKDDDLARRIGLTADQQKRIGDLFAQSRVDLTRIHGSLDQQEQDLQPVLDQNPPDQAKALALIGRIADTRADLEKAAAKMLLAMRAVLTGDQWTKLQQERPGMRRQYMMHSPDGGRGPDGARGPGRAPTPPAPPQ